MLFSLPSHAQIIARGNLYVGGAWGRSDLILDQDDFKGWNASVEAIPFTRFSFAGLVFDASGLYRPGITQYNLLGGPRLSFTYGNLRPFVHVLGGIQRLRSDVTDYRPTAIDFGGGLDYKIFLRNLSWRVQADYMHTRIISASQNHIRVSTGLVFRF